MGGEGEGGEGLSRMKGGRGWVMAKEEGESVGGRGRRRAWAYGLRGQEREGKGGRGGGGEGSAPSPSQRKSRNLLNAIWSPGARASAALAFPAEP